MSEDPQTEPLGRRGPLGAATAALGNPSSIPMLILGSTGLLLGLGLLMVWSASAIDSIRDTGSSTAIIAKQAMFAVLGLAALAFTARQSVERIRSWAVPAMIVALLLLVAVLVPGIGVEVADQRNWIDLGGPFRLQPSEVAKLAIILYAADTLARNYKSRMTWKQMLLPAGLIAAVFVGLIVLEKDFGNAMIVVVIVACMFFVAGAPRRLFAWLAVGGLTGVALMALAAPYRIQRFTSFLDPEADRLHGAWQVTQGTYALGTGGLFGVGLGASREKWGTLPAASTDFIYAVVGEELGLVGTMSVLALFGVLVFAILQLVRITNDRFVGLAAAGIAGWIMIQVVTNAGAVLKLLPITGVTLPFLSYGGSSMVPLLTAVGICLALARHTVGGGARGRRQRRSARQAKAGAAA